MKARQSGRGTSSGKKPSRPVTPVPSGKRGKSPASAASSSSSRASASSPLGESTIGNAQCGGSKGEAKVKGKASKVKRSKQTEEEVVVSSKKRSLSHASEQQSSRKGPKVTSNRQHGIDFFSSYIVHQFSCSRIIYSEFVWDKFCHRKKSIFLFLLLKKKLRLS